MLEYYNSIGIPISLEEIFKIRIIQKNLIYVIGLAPQLTKEEELREEEYFGQYGEIKKIVVGKNNVYVGESGPCYSAYLTYANQAQASLAIIGLNAFNYKGRTLRASYGTTKYCNFFLKN
jgi:CCR4-NOT transcription complex subunit 4